MGDNNFIIYGGPDFENVDDGKSSLGEFVLGRLEQYGNQIIYIDGASSEKITYAELKAKSIRIAECLRFEGIQEGDVISLCCENRLEFPCVLMAAFYLGATVAPLNLTYSENELHHGVNLSHPKIIFTSLQAVDKVVNIAKKNSFIKKVIVFENQSAITAITSFMEFFDNPKVKSYKNFTATTVNTRENVALILCSSGTTGMPKGVQLTQFNILVAMAHFQPMGGIMSVQIPEDDIMIFNIVPWYHVMGCGLMLGLGLYGIKTVFLPKFEEVSFFRTIEQFRVTFIPMVPPLMVLLAKSPLVDKYDLSSIQELSSGAAPLGKETEKAVYDRLKVKRIRQAYGSTEMLSLIWSVDETVKPGSVGTVRPGVWCKVIDPETGNILGPNQPGELLFKGSQLMKGYIGDEKATNETIDQDGWLHTGDVGYYDDDRKFYIVDRLKELIKYNAYQVPPAELEALLLSNSKIKDAAVVGLPDEENGELPLAFIVKQPNVDVSEQEIIDYVADRISPAKRLRGGVRFLDEIPKSPSGKILRRELRDLLKREAVRAKL